jgi:PAS domain S-box-containing protein
LSAANLELVQIREHLQDSEQRLKSAQHLTHVGSWHWNLGPNQVVCSEECKRIFGQPEDYMPSLEGLLEIITPPDRARVAAEIHRGIAEKSGCFTEFRIVRPNGELRTVTFTSQVVLDEEGSPRHIFGACQDVTDNRRAQEEALAHQKLETVGTLANGIAHDFNNLLGRCWPKRNWLWLSLHPGRIPRRS